MLGKSSAKVEKLHKTAQTPSTAMSNKVEYDSIDDDSDIGGM
jgi:hypothetical protein